MNRALDKLVDQCLGEIQAGRLTLEECFARHASHAEALNPLLELAAHSHRALAPDAPSQAYVRAAGSRILNRIKPPIIKASQPRRLPRLSKRFRLRPAYAIVAIALVFALLGSGIGVVRASADSLPGDRLYDVKLTGEKIQLVISLSVLGDQQLLIGFAENRLMEAEALLELERYEDLDQALLGLDDTLEALAELKTSEEEQEPGALEHLEAKLKKNQQVLQAVLEKCPESARSAIERAIERSSHSETVIQKVKSGDHPSNQAPGQLKKNGDEIDEEKAHPGQGNGLDNEKSKKPDKKENP
jgi:hypothetical protein